MMKRFVLRGALCALLLVTSAQAREWELVWADEFNAPGLPNPTKWGYEDGFIRNHEAQYYLTARQENSRVENGTLILEARKESAQIPSNAPNRHGQTSYEYTSASLNTAGKFEFTYGKVEMRAKLPQGKGVWPAFWMLGANISKVGWPACGEIDTMELVGKEPGWIYGTAHWQANGRKEAQGNRLHIDGTDTDFHVYAVEWTEDKLDFSVDGRVYNSVPLAKAGADADNPFRKPQYLLLNFAVGGEWGGEIDDKILPQKYVVDYVRVYREKR